MNWEKVILALLGTAAQIAPVYIHSPQGIVILNASESLLAAALAQHATQTAQTVTATQTAQTVTGK